MIEMICKNCTYIDYNKRAKDPYNGFCKRYPPRFSVTLRLDDPRVDGLWPRVFDTDWCGEFKRKKG